MFGKVRTFPIVRLMGLFVITNTMRNILSFMRLWLLNFINSFKQICLVNLFSLSYRVKGGANVGSNVEKQQMEKEADEVMYSLFNFMEDKWVLVLLFSRKVWKWLSKMCKNRCICSLLSHVVSTFNLSLYLCEILIFFSFPTYAKYCEKPVLKRLLKVCLCCFFTFPK